MPFTYMISREDKLAYVTANGSVDLRATIEAMGRLAQEPDFDPDFEVFVDAENMEYTPSFGELRVLAWALGHESKRYKNKVAVVRPQRATGARHEIYARLAKLTGVTLGLFRDREAALRWIRGH